MSLKNYAEKVTVVTQNESGENVPETMML